jgi:hypothetical protein
MVSSAPNATPKRTSLSARTLHTIPKMKKIGRSSSVGLSFGFVLIIAHHDRDRRRAKKTSRFAAQTCAQN